MIEEMHRLNWIMENVLGNDFESQDYIYWTQGGKNKFMSKWVEKQ